MTYQFLVVILCLVWCGLTVWFVGCFLVYFAVDFRLLVLLYCIVIALWAVIVCIWFFVCFGFDLWLFLNRLLLIVLFCRVAL